MLCNFHIFFLRQRRNAYPWKFLLFVSWNPSFTHNNYLFAIKINLQTILRNKGIDSSPLTLEQIWRMSIPISYIWHIIKNSEWLLIGKNFECNSTTKLWILKQLWIWLRKLCQIFYLAVLGGYKDLESQFKE